MFIKKKEIKIIKILQKKRNRGGLAHHLIVKMRVFDCREALATKKLKSCYAQSRVFWIEYLEWHNQFYRNLYNNAI